LLLQSTALAFSSLIVAVYLFGKVKNKIVYRI
jgi:hypothetical protein